VGKLGNNAENPNVVFLSPELEMKPILSMFIFLLIWDLS
jgi:hypothetical protein